VKLPREVPVMILPGATLFPQGLLRLRIFEPRYRRMLAEALDGPRMFLVAMQKPGTTRESPLPVGGLGLIRMSVGHPDGTSHLLLQGLVRAELEEVVRYKPYRIQRIRPLETPPCDNVRVDALVAKVRELLQERLDLALPFAGPSLLVPFAPKDVLGYLDSLTNPEHAADWVSCAVLPRAEERQALLETVDVETRLRRLIYFLLAELRTRRKNSQL
jgi:Lon protease-like protein